MSKIAPVRGSRSIVLAALAALAGLAAAAPASAAPTPSRLAGPDLPARSAPDLARQAAERPISAGRLERELAKLARRAPGASGYYVRDLDARGKAVLFDRDEAKRRKLASNQKLFTTITALHEIGPDERLQTRVEAEGEVTGAGRLPGDVYIVGGGDPGLGSAGMTDLAERVSNAGVKRIGGRVIADDSIFDRLRGVPDSNYGPSPYIAPLSGLVFDGSTYDVDPAVEAGQAFRDALRDAGVKVEGKVRVGELPGSLRGDGDLASHGSDPLGELIRATNKPSDNFYAEMLLKGIAATGGKQGTTERGARMVSRYASSIGSGVRARDGSGLTAGNKSSPRDDRVAPRRRPARRWDRRRPLRLARDRRQGRHPRRPHGGNRRRRALSRQDRHDQRRLQPLRLLQGRPRAGRVLAAHERRWRLRWCSCDSGQDGGRDRQVPAVAARPLGA